MGRVLDHSVCWAVALGLLAGLYGSGVVGSSRLVGTFLGATCRGSARLLYDEVAESASLPTPRGGDP